MITGKQIVVGVIATVTAIGVFLAIQFNKLKNFTLKVKFIDIKKVSTKDVNFDILFDFTNNSELEIVLDYQTYDVYLNNKFITSVKSNQVQTIYPKATSALKANVSFNPSEIVRGLDLARFLTSVMNFRQQNLRIVSNFGVRYAGFTIPVSATSQGTISEWIAPK